MKNITRTRTSFYNTEGIALYASLFAVSAIIFFGFTSQAHAYTTINSQLDMGESNNDVTSLQQFLAAAPTLYPSGLVTGYFGGLTKSGVIRFQAQYGFEQVGRVGPMTRDKINELITTGAWTGSVSSDMSGPAFYNVLQTQNNITANFNFTTDEDTVARVVYSTYPLMFNEGAQNSSGFGPIGGFSNNDGSNYNRSHSIKIESLQPNTVYYYTVIATDATGNISVLGPNNSFRTSSQ